MRVMFVMHTLYDDVIVNIIEVMKSRMTVNRNNGIMVTYVMIWGGGYSKISGRLLAASLLFAFL